MINGVTLKIQLLLAGQPMHTLLIFGVTRLVSYYVSGYSDQSATNNLEYMVSLVDALILGR